MQMLQQATNKTTSSCICKACGDDFKRNNTKPQYTPRWVKPHKVCAVPACKCPDPAIVCKIADKHYIQSTLNIPTTSDDETMLCPYKYHVVYRSLPGKVEVYSRTRCTTCKKDLSGRSDHHHCPSPQAIRQHQQSENWTWSWNISWQHNLHHVLHGPNVYSTRGMHQQRLWSDASNSKSWNTGD